MTRAYLTQTSFTSGELDPRMHGRTDLRSYENGAAKLRNVIVETTGGVRRRPGTAYLATVPGRGRLVGLEIGAGDAYLLAFTHFRVDIFQGGLRRAVVSAPWTEQQLAQITWAQLDDQLIVTHPDVPAHVFTRESETAWSLAELRFAEKESGLTSAPFANFAAPEVRIQASAASGTVTLVTSAPVFVAEHLGSIVRIKRVQVEITNVQSPTQAVGLVLPGQSALATGATTDWDELAFSEARGWPVSISFHQERMVIGGSRGLPNGLWLSKTGRPLDFDLGSGLDDEAIQFRLAADDVQAIRNMLSGRHLQIFTSAGEWIVTGDPLTPTNIQVRQQSRIGSPTDRQVPLRDVDGATLFVARNGREIREFLFTDTELAYQAADLALLARHLVNRPLDQVFDQSRRLLLVVMADGSLATIALYRNAEIAAWSRQETSGRFLSAAVAGGATYLLVERTNGVFLEQLDDLLQVDAGVLLHAPAPAEVFEGLDHLEGERVAVVADDQAIERTVVRGGKIQLTAPARELIAGLPFTHVIEPLPAAPVGGRGAPLDPTYRPVRVTVRLFETRSLRIDLGSGLRELPLHAVGQGPMDRSPAPFSGDKSLRALGWRRGTRKPPWRIEQDAPLPCMLLSATTEMKVNE